MFAAGLSATGRDVDKALLPPLEVQTKAQETIATQWDSVVGANIQ